MEKREVELGGETGGGSESLREGKKSFQRLGADLGSPNLGLFPHSSWRSAPLTPVPHRAGE